MRTASSTKKAKFTLPLKILAYTMTSANKFIKTSANAMAIYGGTPTTCSTLDDELFLLTTGPFLSRKIISEAHRGKNIPTLSDEQLTEKLRNYVADGLGTLKTVSIHTAEGKKCSNVQVFFKKPPDLDRTKGLPKYNILPKWVQNCLFERF